MVRSYGQHPSPCTLFPNWTIMLISFLMFLLFIFFFSFAAISLVPKQISSLYNIYLVNEVIPYLSQIQPLVYIQNIL